MSKQTIDFAGEIKGISEIEALSFQIGEISEEVHSRKEEILRGTYEKALPIIKEAFERVFPGKDLLVDGSRRYNILNGGETLEVTVDEELGEKFAGERVDEETGITFFGMKMTKADEVKVILQIEVSLLSL